MKFNISVVGVGASGHLSIDVGSSQWSAVTPRAFGLDGGGVSWVESGANLYGLGIEPVLFLEGINKNPIGLNGVGKMNASGGAISIGEVRWECLD